MSNALAIAALTEALVGFIGDNLGPSQITLPRVTAVTPDQSAGLPAVGVNIFLYQVSPNTAYRNADLPTRTADGTVLMKPQVALDLHYLFTFYGDEAALEPQRLLGAVALAMHANPVMQRSTILAAEAAAFLAGADLDSQSELVRFTPIVFSLEELSKLWSFLLKVDYVLSIAYMASVVLIEADERLPAPALPVTGYKVMAQPMRLPVIGQIAGLPNANSPIIAGGDIVLSGSNLAAGSGGVTQVLINGAVVTPATVAADRITLTLPGGLAAGAQTAQVAQPAVLGTPAVLHPGTGITSGIAAFVLLPSLTGVSPAAGPAVTVTVTPEIQPGQRAVLYLLAQAAPNAGRLFDAGMIAMATSTLTVPVPGLATGEYLVQLLVDGAASPFTLGAGGAPVGPTVTL